MKTISKLPEPYKSICELERSENCPLSKKEYSDDLAIDFAWNKTRVGIEFFDSIYTDDKQLPPITDEIKSLYPEIFNNQQLLPDEFKVENTINNKSIEKLFKNFDRIFTDTKVGFRKAGSMTPIKKQEMRDWLVTQFNNI